MTSRGRPRHLSPFITVTTESGEGSRTRKDTRISVLLKWTQTPEETNCVPSPSLPPSSFSFFVEHWVLLSPEPYKHILNLLVLDTWNELSIIHKLFDNMKESFFFGTYLRRWAIVGRLSFITDTHVYPKHFTLPTVFWSYFIPYVTMYELTVTFS